MWRRRVRRLVYTPGDLSAYRTRNLPANYLTKLETGFANLRKQGLKAVLRFAYNYPETESEYLNAQDATLSRVKTHIQQLQPVLQRNADVIAVVQGGFIGAWGEWHTSSNNLTTPARKAAVRDALLQALPSQRLLHLRYPADLAQWYPTTAALAGNAIYALRFANADNVVTGVQWQPAQGRLALGSALTVQ